jgi:hypothetical protein
MNIVTVVSLVSMFTSNNKKIKAVDRVAYFNKLILHPIFSCDYDYDSIMLFVDLGRLWVVWGQVLGCLVAGFGLFGGSFWVV